MYSKFVVDFIRVESSWRLHHQLLSHSISEAAPFAARHFDVDSMLLFFRIRFRFLFFEPFSKKWDNLYAVANVGQVIQTKIKIKQSHRFWLQSKAAAIINDGMFSEWLDIRRSQFKKKKTRHFSESKCK